MSGQRRHESGAKKRKLQATKKERVGKQPTQNKNAHKFLKSVRVGLCSTGTGISRLLKQLIHREIQSTDFPRRGFKTPDGYIADFKNALNAVVSLLLHAVSLLLHGLSFSLFLFRSPVTCII